MLAILSSVMIGCAPPIPLTLEMSKGLEKKGKQTKAWFRSDPYQNLALTFQGGSPTDFDVSKRRGKVLFTGSDTLYQFNVPANTIGGFIKKDGDRLLIKFDKKDSRLLPFKATGDDPETPFVLDAVPTVGYYETYSPGAYFLNGCCQSYYVPGQTFQSYGPHAPFFVDIKDNDGKHRMYEANNLITLYVTPKQARTLERKAKIAKGYKPGK